MENTRDENKQHVNTNAKVRKEITIDILEDIREAKNNRLLYQSYIVFLKRAIKNLKLKMVKFMMRLFVQKR